jgi:hypothetical protein
MLLDLKCPGSTFGGQDRFKTDVESQVQVEVGLQLGFKFSLGEGLGWCRGGENGIQILELDLVHENLVALR